MLPSLLFLQDAMEECIIHTLDDELPTSPTCSLLPLMLTCRLFYNLLHPRTNSRLYRRIFARKFDIAALTRRLPPSSLEACRFFPELKRRFRALRCIRRGDVHHPHLQSALAVAYIMVLEHDTLNHRHLVDARLPTLLDRYIVERLHPGHNAWPVEDACNALAVALFWHMTSQGAQSDRAPPSFPRRIRSSGALNGESIDSRDEIMDILLPFTLAWFRVRPFLSYSHLPFQPIVPTPPSSRSPPCSTHSQSKALIRTFLSTEATLHCAYLHACMPLYPLRL